MNSKRWELDQIDLLGPNWILPSDRSSSIYWLWWFYSKNFLDPCIDGTFQLIIIAGYKTAVGRSTVAEDRLGADKSFHMSTFARLDNESSVADRSYKWTRFLVIDIGLVRHIVHNIAIWYIFKFVLLVRVQTNPKFLFVMFGEFFGKLIEGKFWSHVCQAHLHFLACGQCIKPVQLLHKDL